jgi:tagaturonate epimerase
VNGVLVTRAGAVLAGLVVIAVLSGEAIAHVVHLYRHLEASMAGRPFEVEVSVDETESPTTNAQHVFMAHELRRLGVRCVRLAPRYIGAFEKGVDHLGDVSSVEADLSIHAAIARTATFSGFQCD